MNIFGLAFILYLFKVTDGNGFWYNLRNSDKLMYKRAITYERLLKRLRKCELDLKFLYSCRNDCIYPKFCRWKNINGKDRKVRSKFYRRILFEEISKKA